MRSIIVKMKDTALQRSIDEFLGNDTLPPVVLCIGTDRVIGDALGPIVGELLVRRYDVPAFVYGTLSLPVTALTLPAVADFIRSRHTGQKVIAVDSSLGKPSDVGLIRATVGGIKPGLATGKNLPKAGDFSVTATVAALGAKDALSSVRLGFVSALAADVASAIFTAVSKRFGRSNKPLVRNDERPDPAAVSGGSSHFPFSVNNDKTLY